MNDGEMLEMIGRVIQASKSSWNNNVQLNITEVLNAK
jgi:hypothetical protein